MAGRRILIIPPNDLLRHPIPNRLYHLAKHLSKDYEVTLLCYPNHPLSDGILRKLKAKAIQYRALRVKDLSTYYAINAPSIAAALNQGLKEADVVIHANILPSLIATELAKRQGKPIIYDYLDHYPQSASAYYKGSTKPLVEKAVTLIVLQALKNSTAVVTPSHGLASLIRHYARKPVHVIPNGVDPELFKPMSVSKARKELGIDHDDPIVLLYGSLDAWVEVEPILQAVKKIENARLLVVGFSHGKYYYRIIEGLIRKLGIEKRVHKYPPQPHERIPLFVNASNVVVAPFTHELKNYATPLKIIESLACARPVITSDIAEFRLWFGNSLFYYKTPHEISKLLNILIEDFDNIQQQLLTISETIRIEFSWKNLSVRYEEVIRNVLYTS